MPLTAKAEEVVKEFAPIGKYRVRLLRGKEGQPILDIREYVSSETFEGFTRRGIRIGAVVEADLLRDILTEVLSTRADGTVAQPPA